MAWSLAGNIKGATGAPGSSYPLPYGAPSGASAWQQPSNLTGASAGAPTSGQLTLVPFDVGPTSRTYNALGVAVTTAIAGGTTTTTLGTYPDNGTGGMPNLVGGPIVSGTISLGTVTNATATVSWTAAPGRYWLAFLYYASAAPTTAAAVNLTSTASPALWLPSSSAIGSTSKGLIATGLTALPTTQITLTPAGGSICVVVAARPA